MKRKKVAVLFLVAAIVTGETIGLTACESRQVVEEVETQQDASGEGQETSSEEENTKCTVTFYDADGTTVLKEEEMEKGQSLAEYTPEKEGAVFVGWFATPQKSHRFDFTQKIQQDTEIFAGFVSYVEDTRSFAIVGSGTSPVLMESNWGAVINEAQTMTKEETEGENRYTITLDLEEGDEFQFAINSSWNHQRGYGYLDTISKDGTEYFQNSGGLGDVSTKRSNIKCAVSGNYTFTLVTYPDEDIYETENANYTEENKDAFNLNPYDVITWTYNGESTTAGVEKQIDYYIKGAEITGWKDVYTDEMKFKEKDGSYTLTVSLNEGDEFMFTSMVTVGEESSVGTEYIRFTNIAEDDKESLSYVSGTESANLIAEKSGTYTFTYQPDKKELTVACEE